MRRDLTDFERLRAQELLVSRATEGLSGDERAELAGYGAEAIEGFDEAAAIVDVVTLPREPLPPGLADKIFKAAIGATAAATTAPAVPAVPAVFTRSLPAVPNPATARPNRRSRALLFTGWALAAAAAVLAVVGWSSRGTQRAAATSPAASRDELASVPDAMTLRWAGETPGDVIWSAARQRGVIRISGLVRNDPRISRYQVWLFDGARDERYPVDGGLFDAVAAETSVVVTPHIPVGRLTQVLITAEAPSGVVVSDRSKVIASTVAR